MIHNCNQYFCIFVLVLTITIAGCDFGIGPPSGSYLYRSYNSDGKKVVEGWFTIEEDISNTVSGEWHFDTVGKPKNIGPQVGDGVLIGGYEGDTLWIELNPQFKDNNLQLSGTLENGRYIGKWIWISFPGVTGEGTFEAEYKK